MNGNQLEALHAAGVLVPFYRLRKDVRGARALARREGRPVDMYLMYTPTDGIGVKEYRDDGQLLDPANERYRPWRTYRRDFDGFQTNTSEFLFSHYQLLGIETLRRLLPRIRGRRLADESIRYRLRVGPWTLAGVWQPEDSLVVLLSSLEEYYLPEVLRRVRLPRGMHEERKRFEEEFDATELLAWVDLDPSTIRTAAENFLFRARHVDPLKDWVDLVRLVAPSRWSRLQGDALVALDYRIAAEMLLLFYEDLVQADVADPLSEPSGRLREPLHHERLKPNRAALDGVLSDYGLSPHPGVLLVLEGDTEMVLVPRVMDQLGIPRQPSFLRVFGAGGVNRPKQLQLLFAYVATPSFGRQLQEAVLLDAPPTHILVVFDPDHGFDNPERREKQRGKWVSQIFSRLPTEFRTPVIKEQIDRMVVADTWDGAQVFEYANFTDGDIATAVNALYRRAGGRGRTVSAAQVRALRPRKDVARLWKDWSRKPSKVELAEALWPALKRRIHRKVQQERVEEVPVARVVIDAVRTAGMASRARVMTSQPMESSDDSSLDGAES